MLKRGQISLFIIAAIVVVGIVAALFIFPGTRSFVNRGELNPNSFLRDCIEPSVRDNIDILSRQGGYSDPDNYILFNDNKATYLCYTNQLYETCQVQQPLIKSHYELELKEAIGTVSRECFSSLVDDYESRGYDVRSGDLELNVSFIPGKLVVEFLTPLSVSKESTETFSKFALEIPSEMYNLLLTATSIIESESTFGDAETLLYIQYYPDLKIEKMKREEGTVYILSNTLTEEEFIFSSRSRQFPPGYGAQEAI